MIQGRMGHAGRLGVILALAACTAGQPAGSYRQPGAPISATTRFAPDLFDGQWHVIAGYPNALLPACPGQVWQVSDSSARLQVQCGATATLQSAVSVDSRGILQIASGALDEPARALWVMWLDEERRTAVIGTRSGEMGWILNRGPDLRADRLAAARDILAFNGYDTGPLRMTGQ